MNSEQFKSAAYAAIDQIAEYYDTVQDRRVMSNVQPGYLKPLLPDGVPNEGEKWEDIQRDIEAKIVPGLTHWQSPNFMAFFPCNSSYPGMLGEFYSAAFNAPAFNWICSPAVTELETIVLDWMAKAWDLPPCFHSDSEGGGVIQGSASEAIVTVMIAARDRFLRRVTAGIADEKERENAFYSRRANLVALGSEMAHSSTQKAAQIAGVRYRSVPVDATYEYAMQGSRVREIVEECLAEGLQPFYLTATLGTTATCAVDDFAGIAALTEDYTDLWIHVDAAYAGAALIRPEYQHHTKHLDKFDSYDTNMHKWLLTNFDASCLYVKKRRDLTDALSITPSYLKNPHSDKGLVTDYRDWQIPLGRRFRSLKIWFVTRTYGIKGMQDFVQHHIHLGEEFASWIASRSDLFEIVAKPAFALTVFVVKPLPSSIAEPSATEQSEQNSLTQTVYEKINDDGEIMLTSTVIRGKYVIRVVSANPKADRDHLKRAFDIIVRISEAARAR